MCVVSGDGSRTAKPRAQTVVVLVYRTARPSVQTVVVLGCRTAKSRTQTDVVLATDATAERACWAY